MTAQNSDQNLHSHIEKIKQSGALGRSPAYVKLLDYLAKNTITGETSSEISVAIDVFDKDEGFDVTSDSTVRVYMYNLRQKLNTYYEGAGSQEQLHLLIPKGSYRLVLEQRNGAAQALDKEKDKQITSQRNTRPTLLAAGLGILSSLLIAYIFFFDNSKEDESFSEEQLAFWGAALTDNKPVMIVIGDYYIFGEDSEEGEIRLVREFDINSAFDLRQSSEQQDTTEDIDRFDLGLTYLPRGSAYALSRAQEILLLSGKRPRIKMMSEFNAEDLRSNHVLYIGYISGLGVLESYTFSASKFEVGYSYDELIDTTTRERYVSSFIDATEDRNFVDYGLLSSFSTAEGNQMIIIAGTRDAGLMEMSELASSASILQRMELETGENRAFMSVFEVYGFNLTNISGLLISSEYLNPEDIWGG